MMVGSSSDGDAFHSNVPCQSLSNTSIDAHFLPLSPVAPREMILSASFNMLSPLSVATERESFIFPLQVLLLPSRYRGVLYYNRLTIYNSLVKINA